MNCVGVFIHQACGISWHRCTTKKKEKTFLIKNSWHRIQPLYVMFKWWISAAHLRLAGLQSESWTLRCFVSVCRLQARSQVLPPYFSPRLHLPSIFLFPRMPHFETSPLIRERKPYHLRRARRHHSELIYDCMAQIIKSSAEHRLRTSCPFPTSYSYRQEVNQSMQTLCHVSSRFHELHYGNGCHSTGQFVLTRVLLNVHLWSMRRDAWGDNFDCGVKQAGAG